MEIGILFSDVGSYRLNGYKHNFSNITVVMKAGSTI